MNVTVAHSTLLEELAAFRKPALLRALQSSVRATLIQDIRFRIGAIRPTAGARCDKTSQPEAVDPQRQSTEVQHREPGTRSKPGYGHDLSE